MQKFVLNLNQCQCTLRMYELAFYDKNSKLKSIGWRNQTVLDRHVNEHFHKIIKAHTKWNFRAYLLTLFASYTVFTAMD